MYSVTKFNGIGNDFDDVKGELEQFIALYGESGIMPTSDELLSRGYTNLYSAIQKHGGFYLVAQKLQLKHQHKSRTYWNDFANLKQQLTAFIAQYGTPGCMPTTTQLKASGHCNLATAIIKHGGVSVVAKELGLQCQRKSRTYWSDFANVKQEIAAFNAQYGIPGTMPNTTQLKASGYCNLAIAITKHGGVSVVAKKLGLKYQRKARGYWNDFANVKRELTGFIAQHGTPGAMPTPVELKSAGYSKLLNAILKHGGVAVVADRLGLKFDRRPVAYWDDFQNMQDELCNYITRYGTPGVMPALADVHARGYIDLYMAVQHFGGFFAVATQLGLKAEVRLRGHLGSYTEVFTL